MWDIFPQIPQFAAMMPMLKQGAAQMLKSFIKPAFWLGMLAFTAAVPCWAAAQKGVTIAEALQRPNYRAAYQMMLAGEKNVPKWIATPEAISIAMSAPSATHVIDDQEQEVFEMCQPGACDTTGLILIFSRHGDVAKGLLASDDDDDVFFGHPTPAETKALLLLKNED